MRKEDLKKQIFTIPNILTYIRFLSVPVFMAFILAKNTYIAQSEAYPNGFPIIGLIVLVVAASTDLFDGWIARRFNQTSDLGTMLDPFADKFMHCAAILSLVIVGYIHWAYILVLLLKEALMVAGGFFMANESKLIKANMMGKVASATLSVAIIMSFFHEFWFGLLTKYFPTALSSEFFSPDWLVLTIGLILTYCAFFNYLKQAVPILNKIFAKKKAIKNGTYVPEEEDNDTEEKN